MPNPTAPVLQIAFCSALGLFIVTALVRHFRREKTPAAKMVDDGSLEEASLPPPAGAIPDRDPYATPAAPPLPPALPPPLPQKVPTWFYHPLDFIWAGLIVALFFSLSISTATAKPEDMNYTPGVLIGSIMFHLFLGATTTAVILIRVKPAVWLGLRWREWPWVFLIAPGTVVAMWVLFVGLQLGGYMRWMESLGVQAEQDTVKLLKTATDPMVLWLMAVAAVVVAPVCEEVVFRGYLYPLAKRHVGPWVAAVCTGLIFAAAHGSLAALLPLFVFGIVLAVLHEKTGSIWAPIAVHFCFNGATVAMQTLVRQFPHLLDQAK